MRSSKTFLFLSFFFLFFAIFSVAGNNLQSNGNKLFIISLDGASAQIMNRSLKNGIFNGAFKTLYEKGLFFNAHIPVLPSLTAVSHASIATGAWPEKTGVVSNAYYSRLYGKQLSGFDKRLAAIPIWENALKNGKKVICISFPFVMNNDSILHGRNYKVLGYGQSFGRGFLADFHADDFTNIKVKNKLFSYAVLKFPVSRKNKISLFFLTEHIKDKQYIIFIDSDKNPFNGFIQKLEIKKTPCKNLWSHFNVIYKGRNCVSWYKIFSFQSTPLRIKIYFNQLSYNIGAPGEFVSDIEKQFGVWPGQMSHYALDYHLVDNETYIQQAFRLSNYLFRVTNFCMKRYYWDLLMSYQPLIDHLEHTYFLTDPTQKPYTKEKAKKYMGYIMSAYKKSDTELKEIFENAVSKGADVCVLSDHGMNHVTYLLGMWPLINPYLRKTHIMSRDIEIVVSGTMVMFYFKTNNPNRKHKLSKILATFLNKKTYDNKPLFDLVLTKSNASRYHLRCSSAGDVIAFSRPDIYPSASRKTKKIISYSTNLLGQHGDDAIIHPTLQGICAFYGKDVKHGIFPWIKSVDIMPIFCSILNIPTPQTCQGKFRENIKTLILKK